MIPPEFFQVQYLMSLITVLATAMLWIRERQQIREDVSDRPWALSKIDHLSGSATTSMARTRPQRQDCVNDTAAKLGR